VTGKNSFFFSGRFIDITTLRPTRHKAMTLPATTAQLADNEVVGASMSPANLRSP
jgi:hypothetical protein